MKKDTVLDYTRSRLYMMGSHAAPSFADEALYPFLDRAFQFVVQQAVSNDRLDLIADLIKTAASTEFVSADITDNIWVSNNTSLNSEFFIFITGHVLLDPPADWLGTSKIVVPLEPMSIKHFDLLLDQSNRMTFPKPKIFFGHKDEFITVMLDKTSVFNKSVGNSELVEIKYVTMPRLFSQMEGSDSLNVSDQLALDLIEKASELVSTVLQPSRAAQQVQNNNGIKNS